MKLLEESKSIERSDTFEEGVFRINASAKAFDILSAKIYNDPLRAIVRELSTNAYDAHVSVGKADVPFNVHLPTYLEQWFAIRDFGPGLSAKDIRDIYTVYFASTRNQSDDFTGCLGLGSKSPFSYKDQFVVTSYHDGRCRTYSLFKNESNCPAVALLSDSESNEPTGIEIKVNINAHDITAFNKAAANVYHFFKVKPKCVGLDKIEDAKNVLIIDNVIYNDGKRGVHVIMGQVCYDVPDLNIEQYDFGYYAGISINVPIGSCSIAASRETLHMDNRTKQFIQDQIKKAHSTLTAIVVEEQKKVSCVLEKIFVRHKYSQLISISSIHLEPNVKDKYKIIKAEFGDKVRFKHSLNYYEFEHFGNRKDLILVHDDLTTDLDAKNGPRLSRKIGHSYTNCRDSVYVVRIKDMAAFKAAFGDVDAVVSKLPEPPKVARTYSPGPRMIGVRLFEGGVWSNDLPSIDESLTDCAVIERVDNKAMHNDMALDAGRLIDMMSNVGIKRVYGLTPSTYKKYAGKYRNLCDIVKEYVTNHIKSLSKYGLAAIQYKTSNDAYYDWNTDPVCSHFADINRICKRAAMQEAALVKNTQFIRSMRHMFDIKIKKTTNYVEEFFKQYPLATKFDMTPENISELSIYIKAKGVRK